MTTIAVIVSVVLIAIAAFQIFGVLARIAIVLVAAACIVVWAKPELAAQAMSVARHEVEKLQQEIGQL